jgi:adenosylcobinamide-GDP ribazoletransferase
MAAPTAESSSYEATAASRRFLPAPLRGVRAAFVFLTRIPVGGFPYRAEDWKWAAAHAPLVGAVVGALTGVVDRALAPAGETAAAVLAIGVAMLVTGAFHEDGLADTSDALGGAYDREKVFVILKDSRVGTFGAAALVISIVGRACLVAELGPRALVGLVVAGTLARVAPIWLMAMLPYVTDDKTSKSRGVLQGGYAQAAVSGVWAAALLGGLFAAELLEISSIGALVVAIALVGALTRWRYRRRVGGITGDFLGATEQLGELAALVVLAYWSAK